MEIYKKLAQARHIIQSSPLKKAGKNSYSDYEYFTPEQINLLVHQAENETGLIHLFTLEREPLGMVGTLSIINIDEPGEMIVFKQATEIPVIKAANITQQIGGAVTYTLRYMLMTAFSIADNSLDFDGKKIPITDKQFLRLCDRVNARREPVDVLLETARKAFSFTDDQENKINQIIDN
jgi:hypothetical protein